MKREEGYFPCAPSQKAQFSWALIEIIIVKYPMLSFVWAFTNSIDLNNSPVEAPGWRGKYEGNGQHFICSMTLVGVRFGLGRVAYASTRAQFNTKNFTNNIMEIE